MRDLLAALAELRERLKEIPQGDERRLSDLKTEILGRKAGALTQILGRIPKLDPASKKEVGATANALKREFEAAFAARESELKRDRKSTRLNSSHGYISYAVFCLKKKNMEEQHGLYT